MAFYPPEVGHVNVLAMAKHGDLPAGDSEDRLVRLLERAANLEGGSFRISLTYDAPTGTGKSAAHTDTYHGHFVKLVPNEQVVEVLEFETADPELRGEMTMTTTLAEAGGGTDVLVVHEGIPDSVPVAEDETGTRMALANLAKLVEAN